jgi:hypothetical protein
MARAPRIPLKLFTIYIRIKPERGKKRHKIRCQSCLAYDRAGAFDWAMKRLEKDPTLRKKATIAKIVYERQTVPWKI